MSVFMSSALILVAVLSGAFFFWHEKKVLDEDMSGRALSLARELSVLVNDDIITGNRAGIYKKVTSPFIARQGTSGVNDLLFIVVYDHDCKLLIGSTPTEVFLDNGAHFYTGNPGREPASRDIPLQCESAHADKPFLQVKDDGTYDLLHPVFVSSKKVGYVRVGVSDKRHVERFSVILKKGMFALMVILLVGMGVSQFIAVGITRPILQLSDAVEKFNLQNWSSPLPVTGRDEISNLARAFNGMALSLKQRELSLSQGNKNLIVLHKAGLDLMESLKLDTLLFKIAARAEDLVGAETVSIARVGANNPLEYMMVSGGKSRELNEMEMPLEAGGIYNWFACYGSPLLITDARNDFRFDSALMTSLNIKSIISAPLWSSNALIGILTAINKKGGDSFDKQDLRLFTVFSNLASSALQNASLYTDLTVKINELRNAQEQLVHSTKMAAIGELAANVAHEVNNPLTSVLGYATHLQKTLDAPEPAKRMLGMVEQETLRVRKIIRNLLDFSREKISWKTPMDLLPRLKETLAFVNEAAESSSVRIHKDFDGDPAIVNMNASEIKQVFMNIVNNAFQAMPGGGDLYVRLKIQADEVAVEFADTGPGISNENISRIFEPFFSTKENGDETGWGLFISYRIVQNHGGRIKVESEPGKGSRFTVFLPRHRTGS